MTVPGPRRLEARAQVSAGAACRMGMRIGRVKMPRRRKPWMQIAFGVALALALSRLTSKSSARRPTSSPQPPDARSPVAAEASPRFIRFIQRHALAEIATLFGIPLAVVGLLFTSLATRDTAQQFQLSNRQLEASIEQLRLAKQAAQPEFVLNGHLVRGGSANSPGRFDRLSLEVRGAAKQLSTSIDTALVRISNFEQGITYLDWWRWAGAGTGEAARWTSNPRLLNGLDSRRQKEIMWLSTIIELSYADGFGQFHTKYFTVIEVLGARPPNSVAPESTISEVQDPSAAVRCLQAAAAQRKDELGTIGAEGVVRTPTRLYAALAQGKPITLADVDASITLKTPEECSGL